MLKEAFVPLHIHHAIVYEKGSIILVEEKDLAVLESLGLLDWSSEKEIIRQEKIAAKEELSPSDIPPEKWCNEDGKVVHHFVGYDSYEKVPSKIISVEPKEEPIK